MRRCVHPSNTHTHTHTSLHSWTVASRNRPCACVVSLQWNISLWDQIGFDPALWASDSYRSGKCVSNTRTHTHRHGSKSASKGCIKVPREHLKQVILLLVNAHSTEREFFVLLKCQFQWSLPFQITSENNLNVELISSKNIHIPVFRSWRILGVMMRRQLGGSISFLSVSLSSCHPLKKHCHPSWPAPLPFLSLLFSLFFLSLFWFLSGWYSTITSDLRKRFCASSQMHSGT